MLKLKRVELQGFKSFYDRSELRFSGEGIAAVVGPNGCGKSNLSDAISWVLGEQSAKSLRGSRMEDVIFAGTRERKALGLASVTMTLVDPDRKHLNGNGQNGHGPSEITITRRLFRSGDSEYLIDGKHARLRDIQDLFMGTGLGPESYAIIEQGRIGQLLSSKPQDRRSVIEEAAGITKYKTRRRLAEAKLESSKQNLSRVYDILEEVTRQLNSLKRQAAKAKRYTEMKAELDGRLRVMLTGRFRRLRQDAGTAETALEQASQAWQELAGKLAHEEGEDARLRQACFDIEARLTEARQQLADLNVEAERTRGRLESQARQSGAIEQRVTQGEAESQQIEKRLGELEAELATHRTLVGDLELKAESARERSLAANEAREVLQGRVREHEQALEKGRVAVLRLLGEASTLQNQLAQIDEYLAGVEREKARVTRESEAAETDVARLEAAKEAAQDAARRHQEELAEIQEQRRRVEEELGLHKRTAHETRRSIDQLRGDASRLKARHDSLQDVIAHRTYTTETVKRLFNAVEQGRANGFRPSGLLADFVEVDTGFEKAAEEFLHEELEFVVVENRETADHGINLLQGGLEGRATFLVHPPGEPEPAAPAPVAADLRAEPGVVAKLSDRLRLANGLGNQARDLLPRMAACYVVEDRETARALAARYPEMHFLLQDGICYHGYTVSGGRKRGSGPLGLKRELRDVAASLKTRQKELDEQTARLAGLDEEIARLEEELEVRRQAQQKCEKDAVALTHEMRKLAEELSRAQSRRSVAQVELNRLDQEGRRAAEQRTRNLGAVAVKEQARLAEEEALDTARQGLEELESEFTRAQEEHAVARVELAGLDERCRAEKSAILRIESQLRERAARRQELQRQIEQWSVERARLLSDNIELDRKAAVLQEQILERESAVNRLASAESQHRTALAAVEESLKGLRATLETVRERRSQVEVELVRAQAELKFLDETSRNELGVAIDELGQEDDATPEPEAVEQAEAAYKEMKSRIEALGPVNPNALEEFEETQQRYDFLAAQRQDLLDSIRDTEKAIQEIDVVSRQKFAEAFVAINDHFRQIFQTLFGGGIGEMRLTDETNVHESGIDLVASPPGKRLQNVLLLSGGEKAMTAIALLMAIFRYQPSPFCVLDEVDAPLDEANIGRFTKLLKEMSHETQFVLITHSKKTMESAEALYGVTMQEPGVSKLVSVRFHHRENGQPKPVESMELVAN
ncbi:MAG: chromosome segregation protein SMC [Bryobacterales bacterium]|nr:chromosome segregation protein SMC [Bryobacterales bacterium]